MKIRALFTIALSSCIMFAAEPVKLDKLTLKNGREYEKVTITEKRADGISISHESGTARIKFEDLPEDLTKQLGGFDADAAAKLRAETDAKEAAARAEIEKGMVANSIAATQTELAKNLADSKWARLKIIEIKAGGALCKVSWFDRNAETLPVYPEEIHFIEGVSPAADAKELFASISPVKFNNPTGPNIKHWQTNSAVTDITPRSPYPYRPQYKTGGGKFYFPAPW